MTRPAAIIPLAIVFILSGCAHVSGDSAVNLLKNGGFEGNAGGPPAQWQLSKKAASKGVVSVVSDHTHSGSHSLKISPNHRNTSLSLTSNPIGVGEGFPAGPYRGKRLYISGWLQAEGGAKAVLMLVALRKNGGAVPIELEQSSGGGMEYHKGSLDVPGGSATQAVIVLCLAGGTGGAAYFDDIYLGTSPPNRPTAAASASNSKRNAGGRLAAQIQVNASDQIRKIPRTLYGTNVEWIWNGNGLWNAKLGKLNPQLVTLGRQMRISLIRFPGGIFSDFYHWRDGIGPENKRPKIEAFPGGPKGVDHFGTNEALKFAKLVGGQLMITINMVTGTPQEAADWVRYTNGHSHRQVEYWELGNENYISGGSAFAKAATMPPEEYARKLTAFARAMRKVDPGIKIGAISDANYGSGTRNDYHGWTQKVLRTDGNQIDFLSVHDGYAPALWMEWGLNVPMVYRAMLAAPLEMKQNLEDVEAQIQRYAPNSANRIKIAITEWGPYFKPKPSSHYADHGKTLGSALFVASALKVYAEQPQVQIANFFQFVDALYMGWIGPRNGNFIPKPSALAFEMYTRHFGDDVVRSITSSPTFSCKRVGWVTPMSKVPYLDVIASRSKSGNLYVLAINKSFNRPIRAKISLNDFHPGSSGTAWTLDGPSIDANTGTQLFQAPGVKWAKQAKAPYSHFDQGNPNQVKITSAAFKIAGQVFEYTFPSHSVVSLELPRS